jgi:hypothetical protein
METALTTYERAIERRPPLHWAKVEDVSLSGQMRRIYYVHVFNESTILYTRFEFLNLGERGWALARLSFGSSWENIAGDFSPGWRPTQ